MSFLKKEALDEAFSFLEIKDKEYDFTYTEMESFDGLRIKKENEKISISYSRLSYLFRALGLLKENIDKPEFEIIENARFKTNGIMLDCSRNAVATLTTVKNMILQISLMGHTVMMLYTEDTYEIDGEPYFGYQRGRYTISELKELDEYALSFGIELIPCIQTLGHMSNALKWSNQYGDISDTSDILLTDNNKALDFIEKCVQSCRKAYSSKRIHIGMDETHSMCRGKYYDINGDADREEVFLRHLNKVKDICEKYDFRPMMWGDMLMRMAGCDGYTDGCVPLNELKPIKSISEDIDYVYWDYYTNTNSRYSELIEAHKRISSHIVFAGGAWRWNNFAPSLKHSMNVSRKALNECIKQSVNEVFITMWGDDGSETSLYSSWPVVQLFAEFSFHGDVTEEYLEKRFEICTKEKYQDYLKLESLSSPCGLENDMADNPSKYLLYQDPLMGLYDCYVKEGFNDYYCNCVKMFSDCAERSNTKGYMYETAASLSRVLADKAELGIRIKRAYDLKDFEELKDICENTIISLLNNLNEFRKCFIKQWQSESKIFGLEVFDIRIGGLISRINFCKERIEQYLNGDIKIIEELEIEKLPFDGIKTDGTIFAGSWSKIVSVSH